MRNWLIGIVGLLACALLSAPVAAQIEMRGADGGLSVGRIISITSGGEIAFLPAGSGEISKHALKDTVNLRFGNPPVTRHGADSPLLRFEFAGGDLIFGSVVDGNFDEVRVQSSFGVMKVPLDSLQRAVILSNAAGLDGRARVNDEDGQDVLLIRSKSGVDSVHGSVARFTKTGVMFEWGDGEETLFSYKKKRIASVNLAEPEEPERPEGVHVVVFFRDGSRLTGTVTKERGGPVSLKHATGATFQLSTSSIAEISVQNGACVHLSDLKPAKFVETPYLQGGLKYGVGVDVGLRGGPLSISDRGFPRGFGVHSRTRMTFNLDGKYKRFATAVGLDGEVAKKRIKGTINFSIMVDDKVVFGPVKCAAGEEAKWAEKIDVTGAKTLTLFADFADNHHFNGWAVWGSPYLVK